MRKILALSLILVLAFSTCAAFAAALPPWEDYFTQVSVDMALNGYSLGEVSIDTPATGGIHATFPISCGSLHLYFDSYKTPVRYQAQFDCSKDGFSTQLAYMCVSMIEHLSPDISNDDAVATASYLTSNMPYTADFSGSVSKSEYGYTFTMSQDYTVVDGSIAGLPLSEWKFIIFDIAPDTESPLSYNVHSSNTLEMNGVTGMGYRVIVETPVSKDELTDIFRRVTASDSYMYHMVWFYKSASEAEKGAFTVARLSENVDGSIDFLIR